MVKFKKWNLLKFHDHVTALPDESYYYVKEAAESSFVEILREALSALKVKKTVSEIKKDNFSYFVLLSRDGRRNRRNQHSNAYSHYRLCHSRMSSYHWNVSHILLSSSKKDQVSQKN